MMEHQAAILPTLVLLPLLGAALPALFKRQLGLDPGYAAGAVTLITAFCVSTQGAAVFDGETRLASWEWMPAIGLKWAFRLDGYAFLFALLITLIGLLVILYARYYLSPADATGRFYGLVLVFMSAMLGIVLSENLLLMLVFWELTSLSSFMLIGYWHHRADARQGARLSLLVTGGGGFALLAAVLLIGHVAGSFELTEVLRAKDLIRGHALYPLILVLFLVGAFTKSAQFPFHFWLPHAMAAPTPVSAYLHSATMVKAGVFLLGRFFPVLGGTDEWIYVVGGAGLVTFLIGAYHALFQHDLKGLLAYSTISHLGLITLLFGLGTSIGLVAGVFHIMNHAVFKASLFMATGIIDHETGTRDMRKINGLFKYMPYTAVLAMVAAAAMAGVPLLNGFLSKEMFFTEAVHLSQMGYVSWMLPALALLASIGAVAYSSRFIHDVFFNGEPVGLDRTPHEAPRWMKVPVEILVAICLAVGLLPQIVAGPILRTASSAALQRQVPEFSLSIWHGLNLPFVMSLIALAGGAVVYGYRLRIFALHDRLFPPVSGKNAAEAILHRTFRVARWAYLRIDNGSLQRYAILLLTGAVVMGLFAFAGGDPAPPSHTTELDYPLVLFGIVLIVAAVATAVVHRHRYLAVVTVGVVGLMVTLHFVALSAPDLALTQLLVEIATVVLMLLALFFIPWRSPRESGRARRWRDLAFAAIAGLGVGGVTWATLTRRVSSISEFFLAESKLGGGGYNVVNVILVDFRGLDTLGESTVLGIAAVGIFAMLHRLEMALPLQDEAGRAWSRDRYPLILAVVSRAVLPLALVVAAYLRQRGHKAPGGGFIAGLVAGTALVLQYLASGKRWAEARVGFDHLWVVAAGVLLATVTGIGSWLVGYPFLTSTFAYLPVPVIGELELATALLFDLGVFLAVVGTIMLILSRLGGLNAPEEVRESARRREEAV